MITVSEHTGSEGIPLPGLAANRWANKPLSIRRASLKQLRRMVTDNQDALVGALRSDLGKPEFEAYATEIGMVLGEIDDALANLDEWAQGERVKLRMMMRPGKAMVIPEPLGVVLIIAPWNYPVQLTLAPLVAALAAGNVAVIKPSELAPATAAVLGDLIHRYLNREVVQVVQGGIEETTALLAKQWDHIFYTGNGQVGRIVMAAAAAHLTPVTLELGGKSPAIVASDASLAVTARRIAWAKFVNAGQTCVAPDYVLVERPAERAFVEAMKVALHEFYGDDPSQSDSYGRIINERHWERLTALLDDGVELRHGGRTDRASRYIEPTLVQTCTKPTAIMDNEIFGPILPIIAVDDISEALAYINDHDKPLALYVFSNKRATIERVIESTSSGGVCVNHAVVQVGVGSLPFGGVGASGMGSYHGKSGFDTFSHRKSILHKSIKPDPAVLYPPYKGWKQKLLRRLQ